MRPSVDRAATAGALGVLRLAPGTVLLGAVGSLLVTIAGARLAGGTVSWWFHPRLLSGSETNRLVLYAGMVALAVGWVSLGRVASSRTCTPGQLSVIALLWCLPLAVSAPLFSRDLYSYLAQGTIAHLGLNPYHLAPAVLERLGQPHVLSAVDPFWRKSTAPYGPLFLALVSVIVAITGAHLIAGVLLVRAFDLAGLVLLALFVPRLAARAGADPCRGVWLAVLSPLVLLQLVAAGHNDLLMAGLMVAAVTLALERRPLLGVAVCALAATIKLPAIAAAVFIAFAWLRAQPDRPAKLAVAAKAASATIGIAAIVALLTGFGIGWISTTLFSTPARVRLAITPATGISWTIARLLGDVGVSAGFRSIESVLRAVAASASLIVALALLRQVRLTTIPRHLGLALVAFALGGPALWPWYLAWGLVLLAAWTPAQSSPVTVAGVLIGSFLVKPDGILVLPLDSSPVIACSWLLVTAIAWYTWRRRARKRHSHELTDHIAPARSALVEP